MLCVCSSSLGGRQAAPPEHRRHAEDGVGGVGVRPTESRRPEDGP